jgi:AraC-like DNA-binding protein
MTLFDQLDLMARGGSIGLLALWSWILLRDHRRVLAAKLAVAMNVAIVCYLIVTMHWYQRPPVIGVLLALGAGSTPGLFWLFAKAWFNDERALRTRDVLLVAIALANIILVQLTFASGGWVNHLCAMLFRVSMLLFAGAALLEVWRGREGDLIEGRRNLRSRLVLVVGIYVIVIALAEVAAEHEWMVHEHAHLIGSLAVFAIFAFCAAMFGMRQAELFGTTDPAPKPNDTPTMEDDPLAEKLLTHMQSEMPHRDETLSIAKLAAQLGEQEYRLRRTINRQMGHRNFSSFLNGYRLAEVKAALADASQKEVPIITIALDAGFGSLGPFNRAFREAEGMTPSEYRAATLIDSKIG